VGAAVPVDGAPLAGGFEEPGFDELGGLVFPWPWSPPSGVFVSPGGVVTTSVIVTWTGADSEPLLAGRTETNFAVSECPPTASVPDRVKVASPSSSGAEAIWVEPSNSPTVPASSSPSPPATVTVSVTGAEVP